MEFFEQTNEKNLLELLSDFLYVKLTTKQSKKNYLHFLNFLEYAETQLILINQLKFDFKQWYNCLVIRNWVGIFIWDLSDTALQLHRLPIYIETMKLRYYQTQKMLKLPVTVYKVKKNYKKLVSLYRKNRIKKNIKIISSLKLTYVLLRKKLKIKKYTFWLPNKITNIEKNFINFKYQSLQYYRYQIFLIKCLKKKIHIIKTRIYSRKIKKKYNINKVQKNIIKKSFKIFNYKVLKNLSKVYSFRNKIKLVSKKKKWHNNINKTLKITKKELTSLKKISNNRYKLIKKKLKMCANKKVKKKSN